MIGEVFGRWTVKSDKVFKSTKSGGKMPFVDCECSCGVTRAVNFYDLLAGKSKSCGCLKVTNQTIHGGHKLPEYRVWSMMLQRCYNPRHGSFRLYGARGIKVVEAWLNSFENFYADMGPRPSPKHSIDRIDNDGNYEPGNCRWATPKEQSRNRRNTKVLEHCGDKKCLADWNEDVGFGRGVVQYRLSAGWSLEDALGTPVGRFPKGSSNLIEHAGDFYTVAELSRKFGVKRQTLSYRLKHGWSVDDAIK